MAADEQREQGWWYVLPFVVFMLSAFFAPSPPDASFDDVDGRIDYGWRQLLFVVSQSAIMIPAIWPAWSHVAFHHPTRVSHLSILVGIIGAVAWIGLCQLQWESRLIEVLHLEKFLAPRKGFNPFSYYQSSLAMSTFLVFRFFILAIAVPIAEEWFLRGFLARYVDGGDRWFEIKLSALSLSAMALLVAFSVLSHPHEAMAAVVWFSLINWLMKRTGNLWDCVAAHAITNLLLGVFILSTDQWRLW
jgi:CAAX prenyl protease-like protein